MPFSFSYLTGYDWARCALQRATLPRNTRARSFTILNIRIQEIISLPDKEAGYGSQRWQGAPPCTCGVVTGRAY